jgi:hypothetical protein
MISEDGVLQANVTTIAGVLIFITISSVIHLGMFTYTITYFSSLIIVPCAISAILILIISVEDRPELMKLIILAKLFTITGLFLSTSLLNIELS